MQPKKPVKVFISYADEDQKLYKQLENHLSILKNSGAIAIWQEQEIQPGQDRKKQIKIHLNEADPILLLVSASFMASKNEEIQMALKRQARIIPIILSPVAWQEPELGRFQALPTGAKPVTMWGNEEEAFADVAQGIQKVVRDLQSPDEEPEEPDTQPQEAQRNILRFLMENFMPEPIIWHLENFYAPQEFIVRRSDPIRKIQMELEYLDLFRLIEKHHGAGALLEDALKRYTQVNAKNHYYITEKGKKFWEQYKQIWHDKL